MTVEAGLAELAQAEVIVPAGVSDNINGNQTHACRDCGLFKSVTLLMVEKDRTYWHLCARCWIRAEVD